MDALSPFEGRWTLLREIRDDRAGTALRFEGEAELTRDDAGLAYVERGRWTRSPWGALRAERRQLWRAGPEGIEVLFEDGRPFHVFDPAAARPEAVHDCAPDRYALAYALDLPARWRCDCRVDGPRKAYLSRSHYTCAALRHGSETV